MGKQKIRITRRVRGTTLTFDALGHPKAIVTNRGPREMEEVRKHRLTSIVKLLKGMVILCFISFIILN